MTSRQIRSTIHRLGKNVDILTQSDSAANEFNNPTHSWSKTGEAECVRTYPNRNTQQDGPGGPYESDNPVFLFERSEAPGSGDRIVYDGITYELQSPTFYDTHVSIFGEIVTTE